MKGKIILTIGIVISFFALLFLFSVLYLDKGGEKHVEEPVNSEDSHLGKRMKSSLESLDSLKNKKTVRPELLIVSDLEIPLLFEADVSSELKQFILKDFEVLFEHAQDYDLYDASQITKNELSVVEVNGSSLLVEKRLFLRSSRPPEILHKYLGDVVNQDGVDKLLVPNLVLDAYEEAFALTQKFPMKFEALGDFVRMITNSTEDSPFTLHPKDVFYMPGAPVLARLEQEPELLLEAQKFYSKTTSLRIPSVLSFEEIPEEQQKNGIYLKAKGYSLEGQPAVPSVETGFVYHDGNWKIFGSEGM